MAWGAPETGWRKALMCVWETAAPQGVAAESHIGTQARSKPASLGTESCAGAAQKD